MRANGHLPKVKILSRKEGKKLLDRQTRRSLKHERRGICAQMES